MQLLLEIDNPNKLKILTNLLHELQFVSNIKILETPIEDTSKIKSREASLARIMQDVELPSFGDGIEFQRNVRTDRELPFR